MKLVWILELELHCFFLWGCFETVLQNTSNFNQSQHRSLRTKLFTEVLYNMFGWGVLFFWVTKIFKNTSGLNSMYEKRHHKRTECLFLQLVLTDCLPIIVKNQIKLSFSNDQTLFHRPKLIHFLLLRCLLTNKKNVESGHLCSEKGLLLLLEYLFLINCS